MQQERFKTGGTACYTAMNFHPSLFEVMWYPADYRAVIRFYAANGGDMILMRYIDDDEMVYVRTHFPDRIRN